MFCNIFILKTNEKHFVGTHLIFGMEIVPLRAKGFWVKRSQCEQIRRDTVRMQQWTVRGDGCAKFGTED